MSNVCPKGHFSTDSDYCSECGVRMDAAALPQGAAAAVAAPANVPAGTAAADRCPDCGTNRPTGARYCEVCRYDFETQMSFSGLTAAASPAISAAFAPAPSVPATQTPVPFATPVAVPTPSALAQRLLLRIVVDPSLYRDPDPDEPCPLDAPEKIFHLDLDENTLGRQYDGKGVHPEIVVGDPGISRRHLKFIRGDAGGFEVLELGSANGTEINGKALEAGVVVQVKPGDQLTLGMWTRMHVEAR